MISWDQFWCGFSNSVTINSVIYVLPFYFCGVIYARLRNVKAYRFLRTLGLKKISDGRPRLSIRFFSSPGAIQTCSYTYISSTFISCIWINTVHELPTCAHLPYEEIEMNFSIFTPFDRKSTVKKRIERCERSYDGGGKCRTEPSSLETFAIRLFNFNPKTLLVNNLYQNILIHFTTRFISSLVSELF